MRATMKVLLVGGLLLLSALIVGMPEADAVGAGEIYNTDQDSYHTSIQAAVNAANPGDNIEVGIGTYYENVDIDKPLTLMGAGPDDTVIDGSGGGNVVLITADYVVFTGFTVTNSGTVNSGIILNYADHCAVTMVRSNYNYLGISMYYSNYCMISYNHVTDNLLGIYMYRGASCEFSYNLIEDHSNNGLQLADTGIYGPNHVHDNIFRNNAQDSPAPVAAVFLWGSGSRNNVIEHNLIDGNGEGIHFRARGITGNIIRYNEIINNRNFGVRYTHSAGPNIFYNNNFINNGVHLVSTIGSDVWDNGYPQGGNYWDTYAGTDSYSGPNQDLPGADGMGDTSHPVTGGGVDKYPLMAPISFEEDPVEQIENLVDDIEDMDLEGGTENQLTSKLDNALKSLEKEKYGTAINQLNAFIKAVEAQAGKKLTQEDADALIAAAEATIAKIKEDMASGSRTVKGTRTARPRRPFGILQDPTSTTVGPREQYQQ